MGFSISIGSLSAKTIRIYRITRLASTRLQVIKVTFLESLPPMLAIMFIDVGIAVAMQVSGDVNYVELDVIVDEYGRVTRREYRCQSKGPYTAAFFVANIMILSFVAFMCYKSRHISTKFSEAKYISMAVASALQIVGLGFLLIVISENTPTIDFLMVSLMTIITDGSTLILIFAPKILLLLYDEDATIRVSSSAQVSSSTDFKTVL